MAFNVYHNLTSDGNNAEIVGIMNLSIDREHPDSILINGGTDGSGGLFPIGALRIPITNVQSVTVD